MPVPCFARSTQMRSIHRAEMKVAVAQRPPSASSDHARLLDLRSPAERSVTRAPGDADFLVGAGIRRTWSLLLGVETEKKIGDGAGFLHRHGWVLGPGQFGGRPVVTKVRDVMAVAWEPASHPTPLGPPWLASFLEFCQAIRLVV